MGIFRKLAVAAAVLVLAAPLVTAVQAETRVALVIGNGAYQNVTHLPNPTNDANLIAAALKQDGFGVTLADDLDHDGLIKALRAFGNEADSADWAVIYYAGHGIEMAGVNYLVPVDAKLASDRDVGFEAVPIDQVMGAIEGARSLRMVILDACRNDPFLATMKRSAGAGRDIGRGLALVEPEQASLVAFAAKAGTIAADGDGADSPFATALAKHLTEPGVEVNKLFRLVRDDVLDATGRKQEPFVYGSLPGRQDFYFRPPAPAASPSMPPVAAAPATSSPPPDEKAWQQIATSTDPIDFESFVRFFPDSAHKAEADLKAQLLRMKAEPKVAAIEPAPSPKTVPVSPPACDGGLVASVDNAGVAAPAARCLKPKDVFRDCKTCPEMVVIPAGSFIMGSPSSEKDRTDAEGPQHEVRIGAPFAVGKFEVTFAEWDACVGDHACGGYRPADGSWGHGRQPVINVNWDDAEAYVAWLTRKTGKPYRLLSEAELEYALRAGSTTPYWFGSNADEICDYANAPSCRKNGYVGPTPVGSYAANHFGLYDMVGNVWEWIEDCYHENYNGAPPDGSAWTTDCVSNFYLEPGSHHLLRGGSWGNGLMNFRSAFRLADQTDHRNIGYGFRVARTLAP